MEKWEMIEPYPGAHIRVQANEIYHHGIYIGNNEVVQFGTIMDIFQEPGNVRVIKSSLEDFLCGGFLEVKIFSNKELKTKKSNEEIIQIALSKLGEGNYNILYNNCEHFANYCVFGKKVSEQVDQLHKDIRKMLGKK